MRLLSTLGLSLLGSLALGAGARPDGLPKDEAGKRALQSVVTWDEHSLSINGERLMIFSGEFHPYRLPVPSLWLDVFQKMKALGLNTASFYVDWALMEGKPGSFKAEGVFDLAGFLEAAQQAGLYLTARPGPYINAESSGGGFPGWLQRLKGHLRTTDADFLAATDNYMANVGSLIAKYQITNGGPVILWQPENEYSGAEAGFTFPDPAYMAYVENQARSAGIVVPLMNNDAWMNGYNAPGTGEGAVDIYGHDSYPLGFSCATPSVWPEGNLITYYWSYHEKQSPNTPYAIPEFQGGSFDPWGGPGFELCSALLNNEFERVFYKNNIASGLKIFSIYMLYGGTNWGNLGYAGGYTSYDYGSAIKEDRTIAREKYSELKLEAQFIKVSPGYLTTSPGNLSTEYTSDSSLSTAPVTGPSGSFWVVRHSNYSSTASTTYTLSISTSAGNLSIPQLGGTLTLNGRDSKIHVTDYPVGCYTLLYSTAEIFTWVTSQGTATLVVYGGDGELHELAVKGTGNGSVVAGSGVTFKQMGGATVAQWQTSSERKIISFGKLVIYLLDRNSAYNYWVPELSSGGQPSVIVNGPYLVRSASVSDSTLNIQADFNGTTTLEVIALPKGVTSLSINGAAVKTTTTTQGSWSASIPYTNPNIALPSLRSLSWNSIDSLPEIQPNYDDSAWPAADHTTTNNTVVQPFLMPVSLYGSDYGFNGGALLFRGHFTSQGTETSLMLSTQGGSGYESSAWLGSTFLGSFTGSATFTLPTLTSGQSYVITVLVDNMGLEENWVVGADAMKAARGILDYQLNGNSAGQQAITWKITGNLGGEDYADPVRGPLNEGGLFIERQGYHQPAPPLAQFAAGSPYTGIAAAGLAFYTAVLPLDLPSAQYDIPLAFTFGNSSSSGDYRAWLYVNGYQFGRYVSYLGPQTSFPVPEGILNYQGSNTIGLVVWAVSDAGASVPDLELTAGTPVLTGRSPVQLVPMPAWTARAGAY